MGKQIFRSNIKCCKCNQHGHTRKYCPKRPLFIEDDGEHNTDDMDGIVGEYFDDEVNGHINLLRKNYGQNESVNDIRFLYLFSVVRCALSMPQ